MASDARKAEWGREIAEQSDPRLPVIQQAIAEFYLGMAGTYRPLAKKVLSALVEADQSGNEARAEAEKLRLELKMERGVALTALRERDAARAEAARYREALERIAAFSCTRTPRTGSSGSAPS